MGRIGGDVPEGEGLKLTLSPLFTGSILKLPIWGDPADENCFDDEVYWEVREPATHHLLFTIQPLGGAIVFDLVSRDELQTTFESYIDFL